MRKILATAGIGSLAWVSMLVHPTWASELVYTPINPSFGGNPFYSSHLLGVAGAVNKHKDPEERDRFKDLTPAQQFQQAIQSGLLSRISSEIANQIYGEKARESGRFVIGNTTVNFRRLGGQTIVDILDGLSGGGTTIEIPTPTY